MINDTRLSDSTEREWQVKPRSCLSKAGQQMANDHFNQLPCIPWEPSMGKKSGRRTKIRKRPSTPTDQLSYNREREFATRKVEARVTRVKY